MRTTIRVSELASWQRCRRKTYIGYELGWDRVGVEAGIGTAFHTLLKGYYGNDSDITEEEWAQVHELTPEGRETVEAMYDTYVEEVETDGLDVGCVTIFQEYRIEKRLVGEMTLTGQIDHVYEDQGTGTIVVQDTKTAAQFFETAQRDFQMMCYLWLVHDQFPGCNFAIEHNIVKRNKRSGRSKPPYIQRNRVYVSYAEVVAFGKGLLHLMSEYQTVMRATEQSGAGVRFPMLYPKGQNDCSWYCPFADICGMVDDPDADVEAALQMEFEKREEAPQ